MALRSRRLMASVGGRGAQLEQQHAAQFIRCRCFFVGIGYLCGAALCAK